MIDLLISGISFVLLQSRQVSLPRVVNCGERDRISAIERAARRGSYGGSSARDSGGGSGASTRTAANLTESVSQVSTARRRGQTPSPAQAAPVPAPPVNGNGPPAVEDVLLEPEQPQPIETAPSEPPLGSSQISSNPPPQPPPNEDVSQEPEQPTSEDDEEKAIGVSPDGR